MKGRSLIKFSSFIMLLAGIATIGLMTMVIVVGDVKDVFSHGLTDLTMWTTIGAYAIGLLQIIVAIYGLTHSHNIEKAGVCKALGIVMIIATALWFVPEVLNEGQTINFCVYGYSVLIPVLYFLGAVSNTKEENK